MCDSDCAIDLNTYHIEKQLSSKIRHIFNSSDPLRPTILLMWPLVKMSFDSPCVAFRSIEEKFFLSKKTLFDCTKG